MKDNAPKTIRVGTAEAAPGPVLRVKGAILDILRHYNMIPGEERAVLTALADGMMFGLRTLQNVNAGDRCCFYKCVEGH